MLTDIEECMEEVMFDVCALMEQAMDSLLYPVCSIENEYRCVMWSQLQWVIDVMDMVLVLFGPAVNKHFNYLRYLRAEWVELMETFRGAVAPENGPYAMLDFVDDDLDEVFMF